MHARATSRVPTRLASARTLSFGDTPHSVATTASLRRVQMSLEIFPASESEDRHLPDYVRPLTEGVTHPVPQQSGVVGAHRHRWVRSGRKTRVADPRVDDDVEHVGEK